MTPDKVEKTPEEFGAIGDGIADDRPSIQAAIDSLVANGGGVLQFSAKTYLVGPGGLKIGANVELKGFGDTSVLKAPETETNYWLITGFFATGAVISDLQLDANERNRLTNDSVHGGILLEGCQS
jgi:polygalacturonase